MQRTRQVPVRSAIALASLFAGAASCTTAGTVTTTDGYGVPMANVYWGIDPMMWDYGYYDPYYLYAVVGQVVEGHDGGFLDGGPLDGAAPMSSRLRSPIRTTARRPAVRR